jgi:ATP-dependent helicase/nuclease subunit B
LEQYFSELLDKFSQSHYGKHPLPAVAIQCEQLRLRLSVFAKRQAKLRAEGWRIIPEKIESSYETLINVDGVPFILTGRIDRMDRHQDTGMLRIMDYKTSESSISPDKKHRIKLPDKTMQWLDLQLPLYRVLAASEIYDDKVQLGYLQLGKKLDKVGFDLADWSLDEMDDAYNIAKNVIRKIRDGIFWPPSDPPSYDDGLMGICQDAYPYRHLDNDGPTVLVGGDA